MRPLRLSLLRPVLSLVAALLGALTLPAAEDLVLADFEGPDYGAWRVEGEAFGSGPARGTLPGQMAVSGFQGGGLVNSFVGGDRATGTLTSPEFRLERRFLKFLIGGGGHPGRTCLNLLVGGEVVRTATGPNTQPGGSEELGWQGWDVGEYQGRPAVLQIVDAATGGWGHINVDHLLLSDQPLPRVLVDPSREFTADRRYLLLPVRRGAPLRWVSLVVGGRVERDFRLELADDEADWWAFLDLTPFRGNSVTVRVDRLSEASKALERMEVSDTLRAEVPMYEEALRPQFHFSSRRGWNNDPNGLVHVDGVWHLFYQHNPYGWNWGNMHWGHATSRDLVQWHETGDVLFPDAQGTMFSGSAVVDWRNTSGFGRDGVPPIVLFYTAAGGDNRMSAGQPFTQGLAFSADRGRSWTKYAGNPVLGNLTEGNRDPKILWHEPTRRWIMTLYVATNSVHTIHFFGSPDLRNWTYLSHTDGYYECPDLFELAVDGDPHRRKWVLTAANSEYQVGRFDGVRFTPETPKLPGHRGRGFYAAQTFSDAPDGRRIQIGWGQMPSPGMPFNQMMCFPCDLSLRATGDGPRLAWWPVGEIEALRVRRHEVASGVLVPGANPWASVSAELADVEIAVEPGSATRLLLDLRGTAVVYDVTRKELVVGDLRVACPLTGGRLELRALVDRTSLEIFGAGGLVYLPFPVIPEAGHRTFRLSVEGGEARVRHGVLHELRSAWRGK